MARKSRWDAVRKLLWILCRLYPGFPRSARRRALLIGISYWQKRSNEWRLRGTHSDVECLRGLLIDHYEYREDDITVMMDKEGVHEHLWPTEKNIARVTLYWERRELQLFTKDCAERDRFVFSCHANQKAGLLKNTKADGKDEFIIPCDASDMDGSGCILDSDLYAYLIEPLRQRCRFVASTPTIIWDQSHERLSDILGIPVSTFDLLSTVEGRLGVEEKLIFRFLLGEGCSAITAATDYHLYRGFRPRVLRTLDPWAICFSACKDDECAVEVGDISMTKVLARVLESGAGPHGGLLLEDLVSIARDNMDSGFQAWWHEHLRRKAARELEHRDRSSEPNPATIGCSTSQGVASKSAFGFTAFPHLPLLGQFRWFASGWFASGNREVEEWPSPAKLQTTQLERFWI
ncbi:hypothetical protein EV714DRAFT_234548 [Schizophyllum commune]